MASLTLSLPSPPSSSKSHISGDSTLRKAISTIRLAGDDSPRRRHHLINSSLLLKSCIRSRNFDLGKLLHRELIDSGLPLDSVLLNSLITLYSKSGDWETALSIFQTMDDNHTRDLVSWSVMISCFANNKMEFDAIVMFLDMLENGLYPNEYCFTAAIRACSNSEYVSIGRVIFGFVLKSGYFDSHVCSCVHVPQKELI